MAKFRIYFLYFIIIVQCLLFNISLSQSNNFPERETRAVWLATVDYLDWPKPEMHRNIAAQKASLIKILDYLKRINFNTIFFQTRPRGNTFHKSEYEPWAKELTGNLGVNPGWDPLAFLIDEAHKRGIEVHAWINVVKVWSGKTLPPKTNPEHIALKKPGWIKLFNKEWWLDMGYPECREYLSTIVLEIVNNYNIDGINFDYLRYPEKDFNDDYSYKLYGNRINRYDWRRENITDFLRRVYTKALSVKPYLRIGVAPIGIFLSVPGCSGWSAFNDVYQDCRQWLKEGIIDYLSPQIYWDIKTTKGDPGFFSCLSEWKKIMNGRHLYPGIAASRSIVKTEISKQVNLSRREQTEGNAFYRYSDIPSDYIFNEIYRFPANIPIMNWKKGNQPLPPKNLTIEKNQDSYKLRWDPPEKVNNNVILKFYNIYRSNNNSFNKEDPTYLITIIGSNFNEYIDFYSPKNNKPFYFVSSLDIRNIESPLCGESILASNDLNNLKEKNDKQVFIPDKKENSNLENRKNEMISYIKDFLKPRTYLTIYPDPFNEYSLIGYEITSQNLINVGIFDLSGKELINILKGIQNPGKYILKIYGKRLSAGKYICRIKIGNTINDKYIVKK
jgi:uncharacterized lipoprotein YddW (UPF0748 family)